jgi:hypothetical protein
MVMALIEGLPAESRWVASGGGMPDLWLWQSPTKTNLVLADLVDVVRENTSVHAGPRFRPDPYPRPGAAAPTTPVVGRVADLPGAIPLPQEPPAGG